MRGGPSDNAIKALFEKFERTGNVNDDRIGNVGRPRSAFTESNDVAVQQVMRQQLRTSVRSFAFHAGLTPKNGHALYSVPKPSRVPIQDADLPSPECECH
ncbi:hypothetical protein AVEN_256804-1 [Araneus ventricosus]|uniref:DUF4817 domain-containing protein n=1 Tax=Araneus ventricosus TaxID=182803 RepID=A0A4Y2QH00_ARAVE|nr:hypothetical protein AVEN_256804-1 [Araneus ventricosus]